MKSQKRSIQRGLYAKGNAVKITETEEYPTIKVNLHGHELPRNLNFNGHVFCLAATSLLGPSSSSSPSKLADPSSFGWKETMLACSTQLQNAFQPFDVEEVKAHRTNQTPKLALFPVVTIPTRASNFNNKELKIVADYPWIHQEFTANIFSTAQTKESTTMPSSRYNTRSHIH